jgi:hypothetical protein
VALLCSEAQGSFALLLKGDRPAAGAGGSPSRAGAAGTSSSGWSKAREGVKGRESSDSRPTSATPSSAAAAAASKGIMQKLEEAAAGVGGKAGQQDDGAAAPLLPPLADCVTVTVPPGGTLDIPVSFCPALLQQYKAQVAVLLTSPVVPAPVPLVWRYSISGEPHADTQGLAFSFKVRVSACPSADPVACQLGSAAEHPMMCGPCCTMIICCDRPTAGCVQATNSCCRYTLQTHDITSTVPSAMSCQWA